MKKIFTIITIMLSILLLTSCAKESEGEIITSCYPIYDLTTRIVKDKQKVKNLVKAGIEPHDYEPTAKDITSLYDCKLFIINGLGLEHYTSALTEKIKSKMFTATSDIKILTDENNTPDPHVWLNPINAINMMNNIKNKLSEIDSANKDFYEANFLENKKLFEEIDNKYKAELTNLKSEYLVTSHKAFSYLCNAYNLIQLPIAGLSTEDEPTATAITNLINQIKDLNVTTIFYEELVSDEIARSIASQTGLVCDVLNPLEGLEDDDSKENYLTIMEKNLSAIIKALK